MAAVAGASGLDSATPYQEQLVDGDSDATEKVVIIPIQGVIMEMPDRQGNPSGTYAKVRSMLRKVEKDENVKAIILDINTPGGGITESDRIYHELKRFKEESKLPVVALFGDVAASGGYYVAMASDHIQAHPTTITGSIGVIAQFIQVYGLFDKVGLHMETVKSLRYDESESMKDIGSPYRKMTPAERKFLQDLITEMWERFVSVVQEGRKGKISPEKVRQLADGRIYMGPTALELKLVDSVGYEQDAFKKARELGKAPGAKVVRYKREPSFEDLFGVRSTPPDPQALLDRVMHDSPTLLYLWTGH
ncbi:MAG: signal peptide peptidase SppA, partial [Candidatus Eremiobacterota bacterium]